MRHYFLIPIILLVNLIIATEKAYAHCDGIDGPVISAAKEALKTENVNLVLVWVQEDDEQEVIRIFDHTLRVRKLGEDAQKLADTFFFESLVRIHRAGEGASYTGLKPAGRDLGPAIPAADKAVISGSAKELFELLKKVVHKGLQQRFEEVQRLKDFDENNVQDGRDFIKAYVTFLHYVEPLYKFAATEKGRLNQNGAHNH